MAAHWHIRLIGDPRDLAALANSFATGSTAVHLEADGASLHSELLRDVTDLETVRAKARDIVCVLAGVAGLALHAEIDCVPCSGSLGAIVDPAASRVVCRRVVVVDATDSDVLQALDGDTSLACERVEWTPTLDEWLAAHRPDAIVVVASSYATDAVALLERLRRRGADSAVFAVLPADASDALQQLAATTADDFMFAPVRSCELRRRIDRALGEPRHELEHARRELARELGWSQLVGKAPAFLDAIANVPRFASSDMPVLITGETGTGKELCARTLHHLGPRCAGPFVTVDCGAVPDQLFENELFGHVRGAFTDAHRDQKGLVALAEGGVLFLDEIDALSLGAQAKLLRFIQERTYRALGAGHFDRADVNIVAATNRDLAACVRENRFRADLFFRLNVLRLHLPPLRERRSDIALLAYALLEAHRGEGGRGAAKFSSSALRMLEQHEWPGNVRELGNVVSRAAVTCEGDRILPCHLDVRSPGDATDDADHRDFRTVRAAAIAAFERRYVEDMLRRHGGNVTHAAREARQDRRAFGRIIKKYKIERRSMSG